MRGHRGRDEGGSHERDGGANADYGEDVRTEDYE